MRVYETGGLALIAGLLFASAGCGGNTAAVPSGTASQFSAPGMPGGFPSDTTSILKKLTKDVEIGSTVDPKNGDMGPRAVTLVRSTFGLKAGQLLVCNFENSSGAAGKGTTIEVLNPKENSKPKSFVQSDAIEGCDGDAITATNQVYGTGLLSGLATHFDQGGTLKKSYNAHLQAPFADADAFCGEPYAPEDVYVSDAKSGAVVKLSFVIASGGEKVKSTEVISGFGVNKASGWSALGPSGIQYNSHRTGSLCNDTLYIVDGVDNTVVSVSNASNLLATDEIVVQPGGKKFKCAHPKDTCATLVYAGSPLNAPVASALLPNGNLIVANTKGGNKLVELTPDGKVLATKTIDSSGTAHVFGILATGTNDSDTALFYTDTGTNALHELEQ